MQSFSTGQAAVARFIEHQKDMKKLTENSTLYDELESTQFYEVKCACFMGDVVKSRLYEKTPSI